MPKTLLKLTVIVIGALQVAAANSAEQMLLVGTQLPEQGIYACKLDMKTGGLTRAESVGDAPRPGFLALHPTLPVVYSIAAEQAKPNGGVRTFQIDWDQASLSLTGRQATGDEGATHLVVTPDGQSIVVAHYSGGSTSVLPLNQAGEIGKLTSLVEHTGSSVVANRQGEPHAHGVAVDSTNQFVCVADLGTDEVIVYRLAEGQQLERHTAWNAKPGAGPRHLAFHSGGKWLYCINELDSTLTVLSFDKASGQLAEVQTVGTLPDNFSGSNSTAEVVIHPNGRFVYISNRGHDSTAVFAIDQESGKLTLVEIEPTQGGHPRFIGIEPSGEYLIAANRDANNLVSFKIDPETGKLTPTGYQVAVPKPVCVVFPVK